MKIYVITLQSVSNYGSVLQALATQEILKQHGCNVTFINYIRENLHFFNIINKMSNSNIIKMLILLPTMLRYKYVFKTFCQNNLNLTREVYSKSSDFKNLPKNAEMYCTGSDQVWNSIWNNGILPPLYLSFAPDNSFKFSLSASFGRDKLKYEEIDSTRNFIKNYDYISVRETSAEKIIKEQYGFNKVTQLIDPVLMMPSDYWRKYYNLRCNKNNKIKYKYILIYNLNRSKAFDRYAVSISKYTGLKLVRLCTRYDQFYRPGKSIFIPKVPEFISLIDNAEYVLTDSFHATAFSINMGTQPLCVYPTYFSDRIDSFLNMIDATRCRVKDYNDFSFINYHPDFEKINLILKKERKKSNDFIDFMIQKAALKNIGGNK